MRIALVFATMTAASAAMGQAAPMGHATSDTTRPAVPHLMHLPFDSTFTVERPGVPRADALYYRNIVGITFDDTTTGLTIRRLLARYRGNVIGGVPGDVEYIVQLPDPGPSFVALESIVKRLNSEPGVALASKVYYRWKPILDGSPPDR